MQSLIPDPRNHVCIHIWASFTINFFSGFPQQIWIVKATNIDKQTLKFQNYIDPGSWGHGEMTFNARLCILFVSVKKGTNETAIYWLEKNVSCWIVCFYKLFYVHKPCVLSYYFPFQFYFLILSFTLCFPIVPFKFSPFNGFKFIWMRLQMNKNKLCKQIKSQHHILLQ